MAFRARFINKIAYVLALVWSVLIFASASVSIYNDYKYADALVKNEAVVSVNKDLAYRSWVSSHGGVYVPITKRTPPNPYLSHIKNRDVTTLDNQKLTLMNPAYTLSQMMRDYSKLYGTKGHITSTKLMNPKNKPDEWEEKALKTVEITRKPVFEKSIINGKEYFRYLNPLVTKPSCLKCHAFQGYKAGDIRGGVSVSIPMAKYKKEAFIHSLDNGIVFFLIYILGLGVILFAKKKSKEFLDNKIKDYEQHIFSLVNIMEKRDSYTAGHTQRVAKYAVMIAKEMNFSQEEIDDIYRACMLHDIGKISTPDSILLKPGKLSAIEYDIIKEHVNVSYELLMNVDIYKDIAEIVRHHHERYDGSGYPQGLKGDEIPIMSQIMTVADAFDAMTTNRVYKARKSVKDAIAELNELASKQFNAEIVRAATKVLKDIQVEASITQRPKTKIEQERFSYFYRDQTTGVYNKEYLDFVLAYNHTDEFNLRCINIIYLHNFSRYNQKHTWEKGDEFLKKFAEVLDGINESDYVFRVYGDDFIVLNAEHYEMSEHISKLEEVLLGTDIYISYKHFDINEENINNIADLEKLL
ncbi:HD domain-containing phosphohydrolase [Sulfurimonas sp. HSL-1716]|uniref:HD domain-containing phosphohydrolase n=1 Tax=Hydrocurvibacter sulfurireducens TaxID=3131937 RepID=UPI0031F77E01